MLEGAHRPTWDHDAVKEEKKRREERNFKDKERKSYTTTDAAGENAEGATHQRSLTRTFYTMTSQVIIGLVLLWLISVV